VREAIDRDAAPRGNWPDWLRWQVLAPLGVAAMIIFGLMIAVPKQEPVDSVALQAPEAPQALQAPENWAMVTELFGNIDLDTASAAGVIAPGVAEQAMMHLTFEEQQELSRLLKAELQRAKS
jgi:hypothetical protein